LISSRTIFELQITARSHGLAKSFFSIASVYRCHGIQRHAAAAASAERVAQALLQPDRVDAVAGAIDVAAEHALVRLHQVGLRRADGAGDGAREAPVAPQAAQVERIADVRLDQLQASSAAIRACRA
jgi:hypothetical protein